MGPQLRCFATAAAAAAVLLLAGAASADPTPRECIAAADRGQVLQKQHRLTYAREALRVCAAATCPTEVQRACINWLDAADKAQPTLAFSVTDGAGNDLTDVTVTVDDLPFISKIMGAAVEIDPGEHTFRFTAPGFEPLTRKVVIVEGDKTRRVQVILEKIGGAAATAGAHKRGETGPDTGSESKAPTEHSTTQKTAGVIVLAAGGASIGTGVAFTIDYVINKTNLNTDAVNNYGSTKPVTNPCTVPGKVTTQTDNGCAAQKNEAIALDTMIATYIAGGVIAIVGVSLMVTAPSSTSTGAASSAWLRDVELIPSAAPGGGSLLLRGKF